MDTEKAWAAGFFDGEGSTALETKQGRIRICVGQNDPEALERFQRAVGGVGTVYSVKDRADKPYWMFMVNGIANVQYVLGQLWPYLGEPKKAQARWAAIGFALNRSTGRGKRVSRISHGI